MRALFFTAMLLIASGSYAGQNAVCVDPSVGKQLAVEAKRQIANDKDAVLLPPRLFQLDVDKDGNPECIAYFSIEGWGGSNAWVTYLAYFKGTTQHRQQLTSTVPVDTDRTGVPRTLDFDVPPSTNEGQIIVETTTWGPDDPHCCPSERREVVFDVDQANHLVEREASRR
jgi:hypothetical protein